MNLGMPRLRELLSTRCLPLTVIVYKCGPVGNRKKAAFEPARNRAGRNHAWMRGSRT
jgi:hypothetical protein